MAVSTQDGGGPDPYRSRAATMVSTNGDCFRRHKPEVAMARRINELVTVVGGGSGTYTLLRGLQGVIGAGLLTSIHTMSDSGGSSRRLMDECGLPLPLGDLR